MCFKARFSLFPDLCCNIRHHLHWLFLHFKKFLPLFRQTGLRLWSQEYRSVLFKITVIHHSPFTGTNETIAKGKAFAALHATVIVNEKYFVIYTGNNLAKRRF